MNFLKGEFRQWKWRPKRWWIFLIAFWLVSTAGGKYLFGIEPKSSDQALFIMIMTFLVVMFAAITDRQYTIPKRILWVIVAGIFYSAVSFFLFLLIGSEAGANVFTSLIVAVIAIRQSKLFVKPAIDIKIIEHQKRETEMPTSAG